MKAFNNLADFSNEEIQALVELAGRLDTHPEPEALKGKVLSLLFLNPSLLISLLGNGVYLVFSSLVVFLATSS